MLTAETARRRVEQIKGLVADGHDFEARCQEQTLFEETLAAIADGSPEHRELATACMASAALCFNRFA